MKTVDLRLGDNEIVLVRKLVGKAFEKYGIYDLWGKTNSCYQIATLWVDHIPFCLTNMIEVADYFGETEDISVLRFHQADTSSFRNSINLEVGVFHERAVNRTIKEIWVVNKRELMIKQGFPHYEFLFTQGLIFVIDSRFEISFETLSVINDDIIVRQGNHLINTFEPVCDGERLDESEDCSNECTREIMIIK